MATKHKGNIIDKLKKFLRLSESGKKGSVEPTKHFVIRMIALVLIILILIGAMFLRGENLKHKDYDGHVVIGYLPVWDYQAYSNLDYEALTHINISFCNPDSEGNISCAIPEDDIKAIVKEAHKYGVKVQAALGGGGGYANYTALTVDKASRKAFNDKIMDYVDKYDLDGIDLDVEGDVEASFWNNYESWVKSLHKACNSRGLVLSTAVASWYVDNISDDALDRFDYVSVMAYDNTGAENPSSYEYAASCMADFIDNRGVDAERLVLGIPFYGYYYNDAGYCTGDVKTYKSILSDDGDAWQGNRSGGYRYNGVYDVNAKTELGYKYGGVMVWALGQDASGEHSLLGAIKDTMINMAEEQDN